MSRPTIVKFYLEPNENDELVCFFCKAKRCEQSFAVDGNGEVRTIGVHNECADRHAEKAIP